MTARSILMLACLSIAAGSCSHKIPPTAIPASQIEPRPPAPYRIGPGDTIEISFYQSYDEASGGVYLLDVGDRLSILVEDHPELSAEVVVRPDGRISLPVVEEIVARGSTPQRLATELREHYSARIPSPFVTVLVMEPQAKLNGFIQNLMSGQGGTTRRMLVRPDGTLSLPLLGESAIAGMTIEELQRDLTRRYREIFSYIDISVNVETSAEGRIAVLGEVTRPGVYDLQGPQSALEAVASAGGFLPTAKQREIIVIRQERGRPPQGILVNLRSAIEDGVYANDLALQAQDIVVVPRTKIGNVNKFVDLYIRRVLPFNVGLGVFVDVNDNN
jgi:protein involved in polysaccharide export with SLBB domain